MSASREEAEKIYDEIHGKESMDNAPASQDEAMKIYNEIHGPDKSWGQRLSEVPRNLGVSAEHEAIEFANMLNNVRNAIGTKVHGMLPELLKNPNYKEFESTPDVKGYEEIRNTPEAWAAFLGPMVTGGAKLGLEGLGYAGAKLGPKIAKLTGKEAAGKAGDFIENLTDGTPLSEYHKPILGKVRENYTGNVTEGSDKYDPIFQLAKKEGYEGQSKLSRALGQRNAKSIDDSVLYKIDKLDIDEDSSLGKAVEDFRRKPSFDAAHKLQSELGKEGASKIKSLDSGEASAGRSLMGAREDLISDIEKTFKQNKDIDLLNRYKDATNHWYEKVRPYLENNTIKDIVTKNGIKEINPSNMDTILSKSDDAIERVLSELPQEHKNLILAKKLSSAINESGLYGRQVDPRKLVEKFNQLKNTPYAKFMTPEQSNAITDLEKSLRFSGRYRPLATRAAIGAASGTLGAFGISKLLKELGVY